jgi:hypothetical protein
MKTNDMKNIHVLQTDKSSRLWITWEKQLGLHPTITNSLLDKQHIYITSDEEIKEGNYGLIGKEVGKIILTENGYEFLIGKGVSYEYGDFYSLQKVCKKIILTTDEDLIKNGVQEISEDFLQWFVKNPSCEFVEVEKIRVISYSFPRNAYAKYRITIPKEEPKQSVEKYEQQGLEKYFEEPNYNMKQEILDEMNKQETLEKAAEKSFGEIWSTLTTEQSEYLKNYINRQREDAKKWQQERMYSEEEVRILCSKAWLKQPNSPNMLEDFDKWFEKLKKK